MLFCFVFCHSVQEQKGNRWFRILTRSYLSGILNIYLWFGFKYLSVLAVHVNMCGRRYSSESKLHSGRLPYGRLYLCWKSSGGNIIPSPNRTKVGSCMDGRRGSIDLFQEVAFKDLLRWHAYDFNLAHKGVKNLEYVCSSAVAVQWIFTSLVLVTTQ